MDRSAEPSDEQLSAFRVECERRGMPANEIVEQMAARFPELTRLKAHRLSRGWTRPTAIAGLARLFVADGLRMPGSLGGTRLYEWERGDRRPGPDSIDMLCRLYQTRPDRLGYGRDYAASAAGPAASRMPEPGGHRRGDAVAGITRGDSASGRGAAAFAAGATHGLVRRLVAHGGRPGSVDMATIASLRSVLNGCRGLDHSVGPEETLPTVLTQLQLVASLLRGGVVGPERRELLILLCELRQLVGWMLFDLHDADGARQSLGLAQLAARRAGDAGLLAYVVGPSLGFVETYTGHPDRGLELCYLAQAWARRSGNARLVAFVLAIGARAHAKLGEDASARRLLDEAQASLAGHDLHAPDPAWLEVFDEAALLGHRGSCLLDLGRAGDAVEPLAEQEAITSPVFVRNRVLWLLDRACSFRDIGEVEQACADAVRAVDLSGATSSARLRGRLADFGVSMQRWQDTAAVRGLIERMSVAG